MITARYAKAQGKQLYALPGNVIDPLCEGTALLLREGARAAVCAEDILNANEKAFPGIVNLFRLLEHPTTPMEQTLGASGIAFRGQKRVKQSSIAPRPKQVVAETESEEKTTERVAETKPAIVDDSVLRALDDVTREVYRHIPETGDITVDSICIEGVSAGKITVCITKLEIKHLIKILPGGRVTRLL